MNCFRLLLHAFRFKSFLSVFIPRETFFVVITGRGSIHPSTSFIILFHIPPPWQEYTTVIQKEEKVNSREICLRIGIAIYNPSPGAEEKKCCRQGAKNGKNRRMKKRKVKSWKSFFSWFVITHLVIWDVDVTNQNKQDSFWFIILCIQRNATLAKQKKKMERFLDPNSCGLQLHNFL